MPYRYSLLVKVAVPNTQSKHYYDGEHEKWETKYQLSPKELVEDHEDGYKQLVSVTGVPLSGWTKIKRYPVDLTKIIKTSQAPAIADYMGTQLAVGDFVVAKHRKEDDLQIGRIIGFVKQGKARILPVHDYEQSTGFLKFPSEMVKVPTALLGDDPEAEWELAPEDMGMLL